MAALGLVMILLRLYGASQRAGKLRWDFLHCTIAVILGIVSQALYTLGILNGLGNHFRYITSYGELESALYWVWTSLFVGLVAGIFAKFAIIELLLQVHGPSAKYRKYALITLGAIFTIVNVLQIILSATRCTPTRKLYDVITPGSCPRADLAAKYSYFQGGESYSIVLNSHDLVF